MGFIDNVLFKIIRERRNEKEAVNRDLLDLLMYTKDEETGHQMTDVQLKDEAVILFLAGHETSANALAFAVYMIEKHQKVKGKLLEEIKGVFNGDDLDLSLVPKMQYLQQVIDEVLRMFPPAWVVGRRSLGPDTLSGVDIEAKQNVLVSAFSVHRDKRFWENPDEFDPDRFTPEKKKTYHNYQYFPFGGGPRMCIGNNFAYLEMKILLSLIYKNFELEVLTETLELNPRLTLRPKDGIQLRLKNKA
jgi:cytochrome P450